ncbi:hypothetical protein HOE04_02100 [archaeon]|jgi:hypothetical protein|nr:hypothetical protein [archaeon]
MKYKGLMGLVMIIIGITIVLKFPTSMNGFGILIGMGLIVIGGPLTLTSFMKFVTK